VAPDPANPRYLRLSAAAGGGAFSIASYGSLVPCTFRGDEAAHLKRQGATYAVVWLRWSGCGREDSDWSRQPWRGPWALACDPGDRRQRGSCPDGPQWDLARFDEAYWRRLEEVVAAADDAGDGTGRRLVVKVHLFARHDFEQGGRYNPFRSGNNVNGVRSYDGDPEREPSLRYFTKAAWACARGCGEPARSLFAFQKAYVRRLVDATYSHGNVVYELMNEPPPTARPDGPHAEVFAYFTEYWAWFVKDHLSRKHDVARLVAQDENNEAYSTSNVDVADARWQDNASLIPEAQFLESVLRPLTGATRRNYVAHTKATVLDEFGNRETNPDRLRKQAWAVTASGGHFHIEDPCDPRFRLCGHDPDDEGAAPDPGLDARPWIPVRSIEAFKKATGWAFERARPSYRDDAPYAPWFFWMLQASPPLDPSGLAASGVVDHVGYLAHRPEGACVDEPLLSDLPPTPSGASEYVARLWNPAGTDYVRDPSGRVREHRFAWQGGAFDWCRTRLSAAIVESDDLVFLVRAARVGEPAFEDGPSANGR
jgi:hypothetical protein